MKRWSKPCSMGLLMVISHFRERGIEKPPSLTIIVKESQIHRSCRGVILTPCPYEIFTTNFDIHCVISREIVKVKTKSYKFTEVTGGNTKDIDCENRNEESQILGSSEKVYRNILPHERKNVNGKNRTDV